MAVAEYFLATCLDRLPSEFPKRTVERVDAAALPAEPLLDLGDLTLEGGACGLGVERGPACVRGHEDPPAHLDPGRVERELAGPQLEALAVPVERDVQLDTGPVDLDHPIEAVDRHRGVMDSGRISVSSTSRTRPWRSATT